MNAIGLKIKGKKYFFSETGAVLDETLSPSTDSWMSTTTVPENRNTLAFTLNGIPQLPLRAHYSFTADNQLVASFFRQENPDLDEDSINPLAGGIRADASLNIVYTLIDSKGKNQAAITVYGKPVLETPFVLKVVLDGGGEARIVANAKKDAPLEWDKNRQAGEGFGDDLLKFRAITRNDLKLIGGVGVKYNAASLDFVGIWGMDGSGLFFDVEGGTGKPLRLYLQGSYKAVSGGLIFSYEKGKAKCALALQGRHTFDQTTATWNLAIGYSQEARNTHTALKLEGDLKHQMNKGQEFTLSGTLRYEGGTGTAPVVALDLAAEYQFAGGACLIKAVYEVNGQKRSYGLQLSGHIDFRSGKLTYSFAYGSDKTISFEVLYDGTSKDFLNYFSLKVKVDAKGRVSCDFSFRISFVFENGVLLPVRSENLPDGKSPRGLIQ
jgi:hypothetical protein